MNKKLAANISYQYVNPTSIANIHTNNLNQSQSIHNEKIKASNNMKYNNSNNIINPPNRIKVITSHNNSNISSNNANKIEFVAPKSNQQNQNNQLIDAFSLGMNKTQVKYIIKHKIFNFISNQ